MTDDLNSKLEALAKHIADYEGDMQKAYKGFKALTDILVILENGTDMLTKHEEGNFYLSSEFIDDLDPKLVDHPIIKAERHLQPDEHTLYSYLQRFYTEDESEKSVQNYPYGAVVVKELFANSTTDYLVGVHTRFLDSVEMLRAAWPAHLPEGSFDTFKAAFLKEHETGITAMRKMGDDIVAITREMHPDTREEIDLTGFDEPVKRASSNSR